MRIPKAARLVVLGLLTAALLLPATAFGGYGVRYFDGADTTHNYGVRSSIKTPSTNPSQPSGSMIAADVGVQAFPTSGSSNVYYEIGVGISNNGTVYGGTCSAAPTNDSFEFFATFDPPGGGFHLCQSWSNVPAGNVSEYKIAKSSNAASWILQIDGGNVFIDTYSPVAKFEWAGGRNWPTVAGQSLSSQMGGVSTGHTPYQIRNSAGSYVTVNAGTVCNGGNIPSSCSGGPWTVDAINATTRLWDVIDP